MTDDQIVEKMIEAGFSYEFISKDFYGDFYGGISEARALLEASQQPVDHIAGAGIKVPLNVLAAVERMCTTLDSSRLSGVTAVEDARCMATIKRFIDGIAQPVAQVAAEPVAYCYRCLTNKHQTGSPRQGEVRIGDLWGSMSDWMLTFDFKSIENMVGLEYRDLHYPVAPQPPINTSEPAAVVRHFNVGGSGEMVIATNMDGGQLAHLPDGTLLYTEAQSPSDAAQFDLIKQRFNHVIAYGRPMRRDDKYRYHSIDPIEWFDTQIEAIDAAMREGKA